jgi:hypothetical protein
MCNFFFKVVYLDEKSSMLLLICTISSKLVVINSCIYLILCSCNFSIVGTLNVVANNKLLNVIANSLVGKNNF